MIVDADVNKEMKDITADRIFIIDVTIVAAIVFKIVPRRN
jgi:hypothetical protein